MVANGGLKMNLIVAVCEANNGIGHGGTLPWRLPKEMAFFKRMTTQTSGTEQKSRRNAVLMGRKCWQSIPDRFRPLAGRINLVLSRTMSDRELEGKEDTYLCRSMDDAVKLLTSPPLVDQIDTVWNIGGNEIYRLGLDSPLLHRVYITKIETEFACDVFFPELDAARFTRVVDDTISSDTKEENGVKYRYEVYERI